MSIPHQQAITAGDVTWLSSGPDEGPDCGLAVCLGHGVSIFAGELAEQTVEDSGVDPKEFTGIGWWIAIEDGDALSVVAAVADRDEAQRMIEAISGALRITASRKPEPGVAA